MTALALGRRTLAAHPAPYHGATCAQVHARRHVHFTVDSRPHYFMPDGCAACGRQWFTDGEETFMGYCWDCVPGNTVLLDVTDGAEIVAAEFPQPVQRRAPSAQGRACALCAVAARRVPGGMCEYHAPVRAPKAPFTVDDIPATFGATASADPYICPDCGSLADLWHSVKCPQYSRQM